jgi:hypothetical protein
VAAHEYLNDLLSALIEETKRHLVVLCQSRLVCSQDVCAEAVGSFLA